MQKVIIFQWLSKTDERHRSHVFHASGISAMRVLRVLRRVRRYRRCRRLASASSVRVGWVGKQKGEPRWAAPLGHSCGEKVRPLDRGAAHAATARGYPPRVQRRLRCGMRLSALLVPSVPILPRDSGSWRKNQYAARRTWLRQLLHARQRIYCEQSIGD